MDPVIQRLFEMAINLQKVTQELALPESYWEMFGGLGS